MKHEHFWVMCAAASTALVLIVGAAGAAVAQPGSTATVIGQRPEDGLSVRVSYRDLNLAAARDEKILNRRVSSAAHFVCEPHFDALDRMGCVSYAWKGARPQIAMAVARARQLALTGTTNIPLVAIAITAR
jgi:UrcA family protein